VVKIDSYLRYAACYQLVPVGVKSEEWREEGGGLYYTIGVICVVLFYSVSRNELYHAINLYCAIPLYCTVLNNIIVC
jgi:hypothetical protein